MIDESLIERLEALKYTGNCDNGCDHEHNMAVDNCIRIIRQHMADIKIENDRICVAGKRFVPENNKELSSIKNVCGIVPLEHNPNNIERSKDEIAEQAIEDAFCEKYDETNVQHKCALITAKHAIELYQRGLPGIEGQQDTMDTKPQVSKHPSDECKQSRKMLDEDEIEKVITEKWKEIKPSHEAQEIRSRIPLNAVSEFLPDYVWAIADIAVQMALDSQVDCKVKS